MIDEVLVRREAHAVERAEHELLDERRELAALPADADPVIRGAWELSVELAEANLSGARRRLRDAEAGWEPAGPELLEEEAAA